MQLKYNIVRLFHEFSNAVSGMGHCLMIDVKPLECFNHGLHAVNKSLFNFLTISTKQCLD